MIEGQVIPDPDRRKGGRGAWLHPNCLDVAKNRRSFNRAFRSDLNLSTEMLEKFIALNQATGLIYLQGANVMFLKATK